MTNSARKRDNSMMMSSVMPSEKYSCAGSSLRLANGSTAIDGLLGRASESAASGADCMIVAGCALANMQSMEQTGDPMVRRGAGHRDNNARGRPFRDVFSSSMPDSFDGYVHAPLGLRGVREFTSVAFLLTFCKMK